jgi:hypothetical protein
MCSWRDPTPVGHTAQAMSGFHGGGVRPPAAAGDRAVAVWCFRRPTAATSICTTSASATGSRAALGRNHAAAAGSSFSSTRPPSGFSLKQALPGEDPISSSNGRNARHPAGVCRSESPQRSPLGPAPGAWRRHRTSWLRLVYSWRSSLPLRHARRGPGEMPGARARPLRQFRRAIQTRKESTMSSSLSSRHGARGRSGRLLGIVAALLVVQAGGCRSAGSRGLTRASALLRKRDDAAGSAIDDAAETAGRRPPARSSGGVQEQLGQEPDCLVLLILSQPDQPRLLKPWCSRRIDGVVRRPCRAASLLAQIFGASGGALRPEACSIDLTVG